MSNIKQKTPGLITLFRFAILFNILWGAHAWFTWTIDNSRISQYITYAIIAYIAYKYKQKERIRIKTTPSLILAITTYTLGTLFYNSFRILSLINIALVLYPVCVLIYDSKNIEEHLKFIAKAIAIILIPGIILNFLDLPGIPLHNKSEENTIFFNQIFNIKAIGWTGESEGRFQSIFLEPGYMSTLLSFMLYAVKYNFKKWENLVMLTAIIIGYSLAGYVTTFVGYTIYLVTQRQNIKNVVIFSAIIAVTYYISINYNGGKNIVNEKIVTRLEFDKEKGIVGNNRTGTGTEFYYNQAIENGDIWLGLGTDRVYKINGGSSNAADYDQNIRGAGYKVYFVSFGIVSAILFLLFYYYLSKEINKRHRFSNFGFIFLIIITFIQAAYPFSTSWIYPFILGISNKKEQ